jgi:Fe-S cluster biosynthesis and repair protein YggX
MSRTVNCIKLGREADGLDAPPFPGELGQRIFDQVSKEAWQLWIQQQTMLINENRISAIDPKGRAFLMEQLKAFLFGEGEVAAVNYTPPAEN